MYQQPTTLLTPRLPAVGKLASKISGLKKFSLRFPYYCRTPRKPRSLAEFVTSEQNRTTRNARRWLDSYAIATEGVGLGISNRPNPFQPQTGERRLVIYGSLTNARSRSVGSSGGLLKLRKAQEKEMLLVYKAAKATSRVLLLPYHQSDFSSISNTFTSAKPFKPCYVGSYRNRIV